MKDFILGFLAPMVFAIGILYGIIQLADFGDNNTKQIRTICYDDAFHECMLSNDDAVHCDKFAVSICQE